MVKEASETVCDIIQHVNDIMHQRLIVSYPVCFFTLIQFVIFIMHKLCYLFALIAKLMNSQSDVMLPAPWYLEGLENGLKNA